MIKRRLSFQSNDGGSEVVGTAARIIMINLTTVDLSHTTKTESKSEVQPKFNPMHAEFWVIMWCICIQMTYSPTKRQFGIDKQSCIVNNITVTS